MRWFSWLIPLIAVVIWIVANLARPREQQQQRGNKDRPPGNDPGSRTRGKNKSEVDAFLEEVNRRRREKEAEPRPQRQVEPRRDESRRDEQRREDLRREEQRREEQRREEQRRAQRDKPHRQPAAKEPPTLRPIAEPERSRRVADDPPPRSQPARVQPILEADVVRYVPPPEAPAAPAAPSSSPHQAPTTTANPSSSNREALLGLLRDRRSLRAAFLLQEVLGKPLSQRHRHG